MPQITVNRHIYLFTAANPAPKRQVVIYAHGTQRVEKGVHKTFKPSSFGFNGNIFFYCPEGYSLISTPDKFFSDFAGKLHCQTFEANGNVPNYNLTKATGKHLEPTARRSQKEIDNIELAQRFGDYDKLSTYGIIEYEWIQKMANKGLYDVAVIRNPGAFNDYSLKTAISALSQREGIGNIHCHFCRVKEENINSAQHTHNIDTNINFLQPPPMPA